MYIPYQWTDSPSKGDTVARIIRSTETADVEGFKYDGTNSWILHQEMFWDGWDETPNTPGLSTTSIISEGSTVHKCRKVK